MKYRLNEITQHLFNQLVKDAPKEHAIIKIQQTSLPSHQLTCQQCNLTPVFREHYKSDLHSYNTKHKTSLNIDEFDQLLETHSIGSLDGSESDDSDSDSDSNNQHKSIQRNSPVISFQLTNGKYLQVYKTILLEPTLDALMSFQMIEKSRTWVFVMMAR